MDPANSRAPCTTATATARITGNSMRRRRDAAAAGFGSETQRAADQSPDHHGAALRKHGRTEQRKARDEGEEPNHEPRDRALRGSVREAPTADARDGDAGPDGNHRPAG